MISSDCICMKKISVLVFLTWPSLQNRVQGIGRKGKSEDHRYNFFSLKIRAFEDKVSIWLTLVNGPLDGVGVIYSA